MSKQVRSLIIRFTIASVVVAPCFSPALSLPASSRLFPIAVELFSVVRPIHDLLFGPVGDVAFPMPRWQVIEITVEFALAGAVVLVGLSCVPSIALKFLRRTAALEVQASVDRSAFAATPLLAS